MASSDQIYTIWRRLEQNWERVITQWSDPVQRQFEKQYWQELETTVPRLLKELQEVEKILESIRRNCP